LRLPRYDISGLRAIDVERSDQIARVRCPPIPGSFTVRRPGLVLEVQPVWHWWRSTKCRECADFALGVAFRGRSYSEVDVGQAKSQFTAMTTTLPASLHPWPPIVALVFELDADAVVSLVDSAGLRVEWGLSEEAGFSNTTRKRAYRPRIDAAYYALDDEHQLRVAWILIKDLLRRHPKTEEAVRSRLAEIGWRIDAGKLVPSTTSIRELLFVQGTEYDSFRAIQQIMREARDSLEIIDPYLDGTIFGMLGALPTQELAVRLLTAKPPYDFALEGGKFQSQFSTISVDARKTTDFHDRFIVLDNRRCWHLGASIKDAGTKTFMISKLEDETNCAALRKAFCESWESGSPIPFR